MRIPDRAISAGVISVPFVVVGSVYMAIHTDNLLWLLALFLICPFM
jgi:hypothetical protein